MENKKTLSDDEDINTPVDDETPKESQSFVAVLQKKALLMTDEEYGKQLFQKYWKEDFAPNIAEQKQKIEYILSLRQDEIDLKQNNDHQLFGIHCLNKKVKTNEECDFLIKLIKGQPAFKEKQEMLGNIRPKLVKESLQLEFFRKHKTIFNLGDVGYHYYIILKGSVYTLINNPNKKEQEKQEPKKSMKKGFFGNISKKMAGNIKEELDHAHIQDPQELFRKKFPDMIMVRKFVSGEGFGDIALVAKSARTATMVCAEDSFLMSLSKKAFDSIMGAYLQQKKMEKVNFMHNFAFFDGIHQGPLLSLAIGFKQQIYGYKNIIYDEGDSVKQVYLIKRGEIEISKVIRSEDKCSDREKADEDNQKLISSNSTLHLKAQKQRRISISILNDNSYFGEDEIIQKKPFREHRCMVVSTSAEIWSLDKQKFLSSLKRSQKPMENIYNDFDKKRIWQKNIFNNNVNITEGKISQMYDQVKKVYESQFNIIYSLINENIQYQYKFTQNEKTILTQVAELADNSIDEKNDSQIIKDESFQQQDIQKQEIKNEKTHNKKSDEHQLQIRKPKYSHSPKINQYQDKFLDIVSSHMCRVLQQLESENQKQELDDLPEQQLINLLYKIFTQQELINILSLNSQEEYNKMAMSYISYKSMKQDMYSVLVDIIDSDCAKQFLQKAIFENFNYICNLDEQRSSYQQSISQVRVTQHFPHDIQEQLFRRNQYREFAQINYKSSKQTNMQTSLLQKLNYEQVDLNYIDGDLNSQLQPNQESFQMDIIKNMSPSTAIHFTNKQKFLQKQIAEMDKSKFQSNQSSLQQSELHSKYTEYESIGKDRIIYNRLNQSNQFYSQLDTSNSEDCIAINGLQSIKNKLNKSPLVNLPINKNRKILTQEEFNQQFYNSSSYFKPINLPKFNEIAQNQTTEQSLYKSQIYISNKYQFTPKYKTHIRQHTDAHKKISKRQILSDIHGKKLSEINPIKPFDSCIDQISSQSSLSLKQSLKERIHHKSMMNIKINKDHLFKSRNNSNEYIIDKNFKIMNSLNEPQNLLTKIDEKKDIINKINIIQE